MARAAVVKTGLDCPEKIRAARASEELAEALEFAIRRRIARLIRGVDVISAIIRMPDFDERVFYRSAARIQTRPLMYEITPDAATICSL